MKSKAYTKLTENLIEKNLDTNPDLGNKINKPLAVEIFGKNIHTSPVSINNNSL